MKVCRKVLSIILAVVLALGTFAVAASANGNPDTATYQSTWWLTASKATINWTGDSRVTINDSGDEQTGLIEVEPGDTYYIYLYVTNNYYTGNMSTHVFYSADLLDCTDVYLKQRPNKTSMTQSNVNKVFLWNNGDNVEYLSACSASNSVRGAWGNFVDSVKADDICWPQDANGNVTLDKSAWKFTRIGNQPDPGVSEETFELWDDSQYLVKFPLTIPTDAAEGSEYTVMIPEGIIRDSNHKFAWMYLNNYPEGEVPAPAGNPQYYDDDQYFDLSGATLTFKVPGEAVTLDYSALQTLYNQVKDTVTDNYTDASVATFNTALQNAAAMLDAQDAADQAAIDSIASALDTAYKGLTEKGASYAALDNALAAAAALNEADYTADSWAALASAVTAGNAVSRDLKVSDQATVDAATKAITDAIDGLAEADADYTALDTAIAQAEALTANNYTSESYAPVATALDAAKNLDRTLKAKDQATVDAAATDLTNAIAGLVEAEADYSALDTAIAQAEALTANYYTSESYAPVAAALDAAKNLDRTLKAKDQATVDAAATDLTNAIAGLVEAEADYSELDMVIAAADALNADDYTAASYAAVATALDAAKNIDRDLKVKDQATIDDAKTALSNAIAALELKPAGADYSALDAAIGEFAAITNSSIYTDASWQAAQNAYDAAIGISRDLTEADQATINEAATALSNAIAALEEKDADYTALNDALADADMYIESSFTAESWANLQSAVEAGQAVPQGLKISDQGTIDNAAAAIRNALEALVPADADYTALDAAIATAEALNANAYTAESYAAVADALAAAKAVARDLKIHEQETIDNAATALNNAIAALVEEPAADYQALTNALAAAAQYDENNYTAESWAALKSAVEAGEAVPADLKARDQKTINDAAEAINDAIAGLVAKETKSIIATVDYTPSESETNTFTLTVDGRATKVRFIGPDGGTMTFDRYSSKVVIKSYTAEGEECSDISKDLAYEVWEITDKIADGTEIKAVAKVGSEWETESYNFTVRTAEPENDYTVYSAELASTDGTDNRVTATVKTGLDVTKIRFVMQDGGSVTLSAANYATEDEGKLVFTYDVYTGFAEENTIKVEIKAGSTWVDGTTLTYYHGENLPA